MTIVAGISSDDFEAVVVADSRLSTADEHGNPLIVRDICQKLIVANGWSIVGFAGHLCLARQLLGMVMNRLKATPYSALDWLKDDEQLLRFISGGIHRHVREKADHRPCQTEPVELMIAWMDYTQRVLPNENGPGEVLAATEIVVLRTPEMRVRRTRFGSDIIGAGMRIHPDLRKMEIDLSNFARGANNGLSFRCLLTIQAVQGLLEKIGEPTVGGLFQATILSQEGVRPVPYMYWAPVEPGYGTYVAMRIEDGYWVQEHRPTRTKIRVMSPFEIHLRGPSWKPGRHEMFDPAQALTRQSPGVMPTPNPVVKFILYEHADRSDEIRASWGDEPLPPLTWAEKPLRRKGSKLLPPRTQRRKG